ncbi:hypothetical protein [Teredinibacter sp. KSP-S5-2]|uniref:hypothetical protein n=1 Tax=Teredinibacter sp. KSP-S5-2 TaxID=3034506 RepID=UPI0029341A5E|nr:hypothetical protein [Teredinibacter sp. KSP-S5-2]WNO10402.1 hypothetical protein P5V12_04385 [Teredinibacter sp. KSP-S5-2]
MSGNDKGPGTTKSSNHAGLVIPGSWSFPAGTSGNDQNRRRPNVQIDYQTH